MNNIYVLGSINMDLVFDVNQIPKKGETIKGNHFFMSPGGKGANQAVACAKQGIPTYMIGSIGTDALSNQCKDSLVQYGIDVTYVSTLKEMTCGVAGIFIEEGDNRIVVDAGANAIHDIFRIKEILQNAKPMDVLIAQLEIPLDIVIDSFVEAKKLGLVTVLNASPAIDIPLSLYQNTDILIMNETEAEKLSGILPINDTSIKQSGNILLSKGVKSVVLTLGKQGSVYLSGTTTYKQEALHVTVKDSTAAGDTYLGVYISSLLEGKSIPEAMKRATYGSSLAIMNYGAQPSIPTKLQIDQFMKEPINE